MPSNPFNSSTAMNMPIPVPGLTPGPDYASYINNCLAILDQHVHSAGSGNQITPDGINISGVLAFNGNDASQLRSIRYTPQAGVLSGAADVGCTYVSGADLYYRDTLGNNVRITQAGGVSGTPGSIANLTSPASATYVAGSQTFVWQSGANLPANLDAGSVIVRNLTTNSNGITIAPPSSLGASYVMTLPSSPAASTKILTMDSAGNVSPGYDVDQSSLTVSSGLVQVKAAGITNAMMAANSVGNTNLIAGSVDNSKIAAATIDGSAKIADYSIPQYKLNTTGAYTGYTGTGGFNSPSSYQGVGSASGTIAYGRTIVVSVSPRDSDTLLSVTSQFAFRVRCVGSGDISYVTIPANTTFSPNWTFVLQGPYAPGSQTYSETIVLEAKGSITFSVLRISFAAV